MYKILKRIMDIVGALVGLVLFLPVFIVVSIWIKAVSPSGPVFADIPDRVGKDKKPFKFMKFRSMFPNAHEYLVKNEELYKKYVENNYKINAEEDPRIIKGGIFLRKYSLDELPQFINVLKGEMSIVGPRAYYFFEIEDQAQKFPGTAELVEKAVSVKPGITGPWQVTGRSTIGFVERVKLDAKYAENKSILYDILIVLKTPYVVLTKKGAV
ncbi:MAG: Undecaprenyl-phosphate galactose phosphotransferase [candidate division WWE3 bacterium GW2011_GWF2_41_45]|uniref:Bacterial sugar transferase domain-containing protein n=2 Tax=Katanobacteria TaxID=422282 RepID=A0A1F4W0R0_UNCKA|nr:MAG: Undecaprenyl-phosphate galactose phosphotransferase [candidate division WWE3 bacterium GW2011_GWC2_41_23]KKS10072.1 MAG: Undecaprenyl-phosphate galactose phosphotransferase [candidate division WWE3 bacterium GW2011_GWF2_41_45]KKS12200.1 MAG: Undecaprenyl-phosphate galactose phosphotransferase [candidate division WWE3 bacterium GW2011_GWF1_41_53]KKS25957.1 MAG: Undecaprenyl-phosphate galactose phosphotransferase [candidate division WWE3 bacterium GW2011_GWC1_42_102]KKS29832.1 MAG: Undeca